MGWIFSAPLPDSKRFHMIKKVLYTSLLCCFTLGLFGQDSLIYSSNFKLERHTKSVSILSVNKNLSLEIEETNDREPLLIIERFNDKLESQGLATYPLPQWNESELSLSHFHVLKDRVLIFLTGYDRKEGKQYGLCMTSTLDGTNVSEPRLLQYIEQDFRTPFGTELSPDSSLILTYFEQNIQRKTDRNVDIKVFNVDLVLQWGKKLELPYGNDVVQINQFKVDNYGSVYMMSGRNPEKNNQRLLRPQGGRYVVFHYNQTDNKLKEYDISFKDKQVIAAIGKVNRNNEMIVAGYYSNDYSFSAAGTFLFRIKEKGQALEAAAYMAFNKDFLATMMRSREVERTPELSDLFLDHIFISDQNEIYLIGEKYSVAERVNTDLNTGRPIVELIHHYDDIVISKLELSGKIKWSRRIAKEQHTVNEMDRCGYNYYYDGTLNIYFNDHPDNDKILRENPNVLINSWNGSRSGVVSHVQLNALGEMDRKILLSSKAAGGMLMPALSSQEFRRPIILGLMQNREYRLVKAGG
jgi:hypothetical protein